MRYNRKLKVGLALAFVLIVGAVAWSYLRRAYQDYLYLTKPEKVAKNILRLAKGFEYTESRNGKPVFKIVANQSVEIRQGANILEGVELEKYDENGKVTDSVSSGRASYEPQQKLAEFDQRVELHLSNGITVRTDHLKVDMNAQQAEIVNGYFFESGKYTGKGSRLHYRIKEHELEMQDGAELFVRNGEQVESYVKSDQAVLLMAKNQIFLRGNVFARKDDDTLRSDSVELAYDFDTHQLMQVIARENAVASSVKPGGTQTLTASIITLPVINGRATSFDATSDSQPARMEVRDGANGKSLEAARIQGTFDPAGNLSLLNSRQDVRFAVLATGPKIQSAVARGEFAAGKLSLATFSEQARMQDEQRGITLQAAMLRIAFNGAGDAERVEAAGNATMDRTAADRKTETQMSADRLDGVLGQDSKFKRAIGTGNSRMRLRNLTDNSTRTITAAKIVGDFDAEGNVNALSAEQKVALDMEGEQAHRQAFSDFLESRITSGKITWMRQWPNFRFDDGESTLTGETAIYQDAVITVAKQKQRPVLTRADARTAADRFLVYEKENKLLAHGSVQSEVRKKSAPESSFPAFKENEPIFIESQDLQLVKNEATYAGTVKAHQRSDFVFADRMVLHSDSGLVATGSVKTVFYRESKGQLKKVTASAPRLTCDRDARIAHYSGGVRMVTQDGTVSSRLLDVYFDKNDQVENAVAQQNVLIQQGTRTGTGNEAEYSFSANRITLIGNQAQIIDTARGKTRGRRLTFYIGDDRIVVES
ncbi:MAG TPA: LptA/OstA family protein [Acidobacteriota bacterium]|nr:LptA/OstA family protein [Acidobacteriota bacterium]